LPALIWQRHSDGLASKLESMWWDFTLDDLDELLGFVAAEASHTTDKKLRKELDVLYARIRRKMESYDDGLWQQAFWSTPERTDGSHALGAAARWERWSIEMRRGATTVLIPRGGHVAADWWPQGLRLPHQAAGSRTPTRWKRSRSREGWWGTRADHGA
jgi:hypothetical protein